MAAGTRTDAGTTRATGAETIVEMALRSPERHAGPALRYHRDGDWRELSYAELGTTIRDIARGLIALGIEPGDRVSILSSTRAEWTLADLGANTLLLTNSAGSLTQRTRPGDLMMISDHINYAGMNPLIGEPSDKRFVNMVNAYDPALRSQAREIGARLDISLKEGIYLWYSGPSFETVAEIQMAIRLGANAVGMSTAPEVILARMLGLRVWACPSITNMGAGLSDENISHEHTKTMAVQGSEKLKRLIPALLEAI